MRNFFTNLFNRMSAKLEIVPAYGLDAVQITEAEIASDLFYGCDR